MKIVNDPKPAVVSPTPEKSAPAATAAATPAPATGWKPAGAAPASKPSTTATFQTAPASTEQARKTLAGQATRAVMAAIDGGNTHPLIERFGEALGVGLGVVVTEALALSKDWNSKLVDGQGKPVQHVEGADRIGDHDLRKRHQEVVGPKITALLSRLPAGVIHDLVEGVGKGATEAPGDSYRLEAAISDALKHR